MSTITAWEAGLTCEADGCGGEFTLGEEVLYWYGRKMHPACASGDAASRRAAAGEGEDVLAVARRLVEAGGRVILTRRQVRELAGLAQGCGVVPVRKPDHGRHSWYGRMAGWSAQRVAAGLGKDEVVGLWLDFLEAGRIPPLKHQDLALVVSVIDS